MIIAQKIIEYNGAKELKHFPGIGAWYNIQAFLIEPSEQ